MRAEEGQKKPNMAGEKVIPKTEKRASVEDLAVAAFGKWESEETPIPPEEQAEEKKGKSETHKLSLDLLRYYRSSSVREMKKKISAMRGQKSEKYPNFETAVAVALDILDDKEEWRSALIQIIRLIKNKLERVKNKKKQGRGRQLTNFDREEEKLESELSEFNRFLIEVSREIADDSKISAENLAEYTLAWAFDDNLWTAEEKEQREAAQKLASEYLALSKEGEWTPERKMALKELIREIWPRLDMAVCAKMIPEGSAGAMKMEGIGLDSQAGLWLFDLAGIYRAKDLPLSAEEAKELKMIKPGETYYFPPGGGERVPGDIMFNLGKKEGIVSSVRDAAKGMRKQGQEMTPEFYKLISPQERDLWCDHHGSMSDVSTSAAKFFFNTLAFLGFFESDDQYFKEWQAKGYNEEIIKQVIDFITQEDNKSHPAWREQGEGDWEKNSPRTVLGLLSRVNFTRLLGLAKDFGGTEDFTRILTDEQIEKLDLEKESEAQKKSVETAKAMKKELDEKGFAVKLNEQGRVRAPIYKTESPAFGTVLFTTGGFPGGIDAIRGLYGSDAAYVIYNLEQRSLFISTTGKNLPDNLLGDIGFLLRDKMWIVPPGSVEFCKIRQIMAALGVKDKKIAENRFLLDAVKAQEVEKGKLERVAIKYLTPFLDYLVENSIVPSSAIKEKIGNDFFTLLEAEMQTYLKSAVPSSNVKEGAYQLRVILEALEANEEKSAKNSSLINVVIQAFAGIMRKKIGDRLFSLLSADINAYMGYVNQTKQVKNEGDPETIQSLRKNNLPKLKEVLLRGEEKRRRTEKYLIKIFGPAYDDLFKI